MREILFRGKRLDNGEWAFGYVVSVSDTSRATIFIPQDPNKLSWSVLPIAVDHSTVGQYTGLTDKTGKRIFAGDVVKYHDSPTLYLVKWNDTYPGFWLWRQNDYKHLLNPAVEVVGNVADNPELLGGR